MKKEIRYDTTDVSNRDFAMPVEVTTTDATDPAQQATGEQQDGLVVVHADGGDCHGVALIDGRCPSCGITPDMQSTELWEAPLRVSDRPPQPRGLARLDHLALTELRAIVLAVIDRYPWQFYPDGDEWEKETPETNTERLNFCDAIAAEIVRRTTPAVQRAAPATTATATGARRAKGERG